MRTDFGTTTFFVEDLVVNIIITIQIRTHSQTVLVVKSIYIKVSKKSYS